MRSYPGPVLIGLATVLWGTTGTTQAIGLNAATPLTVGALRLLIATVALFALAGFTGHLRQITGMRRPATLFAALGVAAYQPFFFLAVDHTGVVIGTIVAIGSAPVFAGLLAWAYDRTPPTRLWTGATVVAIAGVSLLVAAGNELGTSAVGIGFAVIAGAAYATYVIAARQFSRDGDVVGATTIIFALAAVLLLPLLATADLGWVGTVKGATAIIYLGTLATAAAYLLFAKGLEQTKSTTATTLSLGEPVDSGTSRSCRCRRTPTATWLGRLCVADPGIGCGSHGGTFQPVLFDGK